MCKVIRKILFLIFILFITPIYSNVEQRRAELVNVIDEELKEVARLNKQVGASRPDLMLRMGQVLLEKARLLKDRENQKYLELPAADRSNINREEFFKESKRYFEQAQKTVIFLLKKFKNFKERPDAYYILAYNAKELKQEEQSKKFFQKALDESSSGSLIADKSRIALAEMYFNKGSYDNSLKLYEPALKNKRDRWWTKDAFNLSWCYLKTGRFDKAIALMLEIYDLSKSPKYIDMSKSVERDLAYFYTEAGKPNEAVEFYKKNGKSVSEIMLKVGRYLKAQGNHSGSEKILSEGLQYKTSDKEDVDFNIELIDLYDKAGQDAKHLRAARSLSVQLSKGNLNKDQIDILKYHSEKMSALVQGQLVAKAYETLPEVREKKAATAYEYFMIVALTDPGKAQKSYFLAGETYFSIDKFDKSIPLYAESIKKSIDNKDKETEKLANNAMMAALSKNVSAKTVDEYLVPAYVSYLELDPKGEKSGVVYQRLFSAQMDKKNISDAEKTLLNYRSNFPKETLVQEKMLAKIMDFYKDNGNKEALTEWSRKIENKEFNVSPEYIQKLKTLLLGIQFEKVEAANNKGDKKIALKGYLTIYKSQDSTQDAKKTSAYNIAVLFYESGNWKQMSQWAERALAMMSITEVGKFEKDFILFSTDLFQRRQFVESANLSEKLFDKMCQTKSKNLSIFFKNANVVYLAEKEFEKSMALLRKAPNCSIDKEIISSGYLDHLNELAQSSKWGTFNEVVKALEASKEMWPHLIYPSNLLANELENIGRTEDAAKIKGKIENYFTSSEKSKGEIPLEGLDAIALIRVASLEEKISKLNQMRLVFPENKYNEILKKKFKMLEQITSDAIAIAELGSGIGIVRAYRRLIEAHDTLRNEIEEFIPEGKSTDYVSSFKKGMEKLVLTLLKQSSDFKENAKKMIEKQNILSEDNRWFYSVAHTGFIPEYFNEKQAVIMNRSGMK